MTTVLHQLTTGLIRSMEKDNSVYLIGEDILDPYGGAFKVTKGLSGRFPERVWTTPISEASIVGLAIGMAMRGLRPVVEIMFGDFLTLTMDQIINHASKFRWVYNNQVKVPMVVRTPMGGHRGYGPTHSQCLEKLFLGIPGLRVVAANTVGDPGLLLENAIFDDDPVLFIEHKLLYPCQLVEPGKAEFQDWNIEKIGDMYPTYWININNKSKVTIATYGYNFELVRQAAHELLIEEEIYSDIYLFSQLNPTSLSVMSESLRKTKKLVTVEEGTVTMGWGSEVAARVSESDQKNLKIIRIGAKDYPIANSRILEDQILPSKNEIKMTIKKMVGL
jgi:pyruvate/2-oxoglutarate/acetoin dehydrogenase E1 component